jgi:hypothetical protein
LKLSNMISAVFSLFSGGLRGGSVYDDSADFTVAHGGDVRGERSDPQARHVGT